MKIGFYVALCIALSACNQTNIGLQKTAQGTTVSLNNDNSILMFLTPDCPLCHLYSMEFLKLSEKYTNDFAFYGVLPGKLYSTEEIVHYVDSFNFNLPIILDEDYKLTEFVQATTTPEFILLDSTGSIKYQGKMDDWAIDLAQKRIAPTTFYLEDAMKQYLSDKKVEHPYVTPVGCAIER